MKLDIANKDKNNSPSTNKGEKKTTKRGLKEFNPLTYAFELREKVFLNEEGKKQVSNLKKEYYRVVAIRQANLGDMIVNVMDLEKGEDKNIHNPYLAHFFSPLNPKTDE